MKQSEKLDLILKGLYEHKDDGLLWSIEGICELYAIPFEPYDEIRRLAHRLQDEKLIRAQFTKSDTSAQLTSYGIEYVEEDSFSNKGHSIITNTYNISNSPNASIVTHSTNVTITNNNIDEVKRLMQDLREMVIDNALVTNQSQIDIMECLDEINTSIEAKKKPRFALDRLIEITSGLAGIGSFAIALKETIMK